MADNTHTQEPKKVEKVVTGTVKTKKKNEISKFADVFISEDISNVKNFVLWRFLCLPLKKRFLIS